MKKLICILALVTLVSAGYAFAQYSSQTSPQSTPQQPQAGSSQGTQQQPQAGSSQGTQPPDQEQNKPRGDENETRQGKDRHEAGEAEERHDRDEERGEHRAGKHPLMKKKIERAIRQEPSLASSNVVVNVNNNNQIVLTGAVDTPEKKQKAEEIARAQAGNMVVINQITTTNVANVTSGAGGTTGAATSESRKSSTSSQTGAVGAPTQSSGSASSTTVESVFSSLSPGSSVCVNVNNNNQIVMTGNVPQERDKRRLEDAMQSSASGRTVVNQVTTTNVTNAPR